MSKSVGNIIDPLVMIDKYGTDALRFTLAALAIPGMDISLSEERMTGYRAFVNKIWNASRFVLMNLKESEYMVKEEELTLVDRWIRSRVTTITREMNESLEQYKFYEAADKIYHFIWHEFCDWYLELVKPELKTRNNTSYAVLIDMLDRILKLLHPFKPFVTEEIWQLLPGAGESLVTAEFPAEEDAWCNKDAEKVLNQLQKLIIEIRTIKAENRIPPRKEIDLWVKAGDIAEKQIVRENQECIQFLACVRSIKNMEEFPRGKKFLKGIAGNVEIGIPLTEGLVDLGKEQQRLKKELLKVKSEAGKIKSRLDNENFCSRAPKEVFRKTEERLHELQDKKEKLNKNLKHINSLME
jgi:valyl-tRNA synthetase